MMIRTAIKRKIHAPLTPLWICTFMDVIGISILNPFLPQFILKYGATVSQVGLVLAVNSFIAFFSSIIWGGLSDRFGRKPIILICRIGSVVGYLILAFSGNLALLIAARILDGLFSRSILISLTMVGDNIPAHERSLEMSKIGLAWIFGGLVGPGIGAFLSSTGLTGLGIFSAALSFTAILITHATYKESNQRMLDLSQTERRKPAISLAILKESTPRALLVQSLFMTLSHFIFATTVSLLIVTRFGLSNAQIGWTLAGIGCVNLLIRLFFFPHVLRRLKDERALMVGLWIFFGSFIWLIFLDSLWQYILVYILVSFATTISVDLMNGIMSRKVDQKQIGEMIGLNSAVENVSLILGPIIGSSLLAVSNPGFYGLSAAVFSMLALAIGRYFIKSPMVPAPAEETGPG